MGANANTTAYTCNVKANVTGSTYAGATRTVSTSITVNKADIPDLGNLLLSNVEYSNTKPATVPLNGAERFTLSLSNNTAAPANTTFTYEKTGNIPNTGAIPLESSFILNGSSLTIKTIT
jgi:hypothetical protein